MVIGGAELVAYQLIRWREAGDRSFPGTPGRVLVEERCRPAPGVVPGASRLAYRLRGAGRDGPEWIPRATRAVLHALTRSVTAMALVERCRLPWRSVGLQ